MASRLNHVGVISMLDVCRPLLTLFSDFLALYCDPLHGWHRLCLFPSLPIMRLGGNTLVFVELTSLIRGIRA